MVENDESVLMVGRRDIVTRDVERNREQVGGDIAVRTECTRQPKGERKS